MGSWILKGWEETGKGFSGHKGQRKPAFPFTESTNILKNLRESLLGRREKELVKEVKQEKRLKYTIVLGVRK